MAIFHTALSALFFYQRLGSAGSVCVTGCSCTDEAFGRSLLCMALPFARIPLNIPENCAKIRIEQSHLVEIPQAAFAAVSALTFLWLNFNNITLMNVRSLEGLHKLTELRMQGNKLRSIPWTAFRDTPNLDILDLKHNRIDVLPEYALRHLPKLTYFDLSFNQLTIISRDVFLNWPRIQTQTAGSKEERANVVVALHDNRWLCDCRLKGFVEFINTISPPLILMNSYMSCSGPGSRAGKFFHEIELKKCLKPEASSPQPDVSLPLGSKVTLRCLVKSRPEAVIRWSYSLKRIRAFTVSQTWLSDDTISSALIIPAVHVADRGVYTCAANNFIGNSSVSVQLDVVLDHNSTFPPSPAFPLASVDESVYVDMHIAKQTNFGITVEWFALTEKPAETWFTIYFGRYGASEKNAIYVGPGTTSFSVNDLLPLTKYEVCVTARNQPPRDGQCVVFVTGSDVNPPEQRAGLVHIVVVVCGMVLAVPAGICLCASNTRTHCCVRCADLYNRHQQSGGERRETFDGLQGANEEGLRGDSAEVRMKTSSEQKTPKRNSSAQLY